MYYNKGMGIYWEPGTGEMEPPEPGRLIGEILLDMAACGLFLLSAMRMACLILSLDFNRFSELQVLERGLLFLAPLLIINRGVCEWFPRFRFRIQMGCSLFYFIQIVYYLWKKKSSISHGGNVMASKYIQLVNYYYKTNYVIETTKADGAWELPVAGILVLFFFLLFGVLVSLSGRRILMGVLPFLFLNLLLLVGHAPDFVSVALGFAGVVLSAGRSWDRFDSTDCSPMKEGRRAEIAGIVLLVVLAAVIPPGCRLILGEQAKQLAAKGDTVKVLQNKLEVQAGKYASVFTRESFQSVNNRTPRYNGKELLRYTVKDGRDVEWAEAFLDYLTYWGDDDYFWKDDVGSLEKSIRYKLKCDEKGDLIRSAENLQKIFEEGLRTGEADDTFGYYKPQEVHYLRGSYGVDYVNGRWTDDEEAFADACSKAGYKAEELSALIAQSGKQTFEGVDKKWKKDGIEWKVQILDRLYREFNWVSTSIRYTGFHSGTAYLPRHLIYGEGEEVPSFTGDSKLAKSFWQDTVGAECWEASFGDFASSYYTVMHDELDDSNVWAVFSNSYEAGSSSEEMEWYNQYVLEHFLGIPAERVPSIGGTATELRMERLDNLLEGSDFSGYPNESAVIKNSARAAYAQIVKEYLSQMFYSLELDRISDGTDPVEYFLTDSQEGYCVHFASAGVLLLRSLGVPARFASGYVARPNQFRRNPDGSYTASILDSDAHAWAEIYLDNIGWIPIEMTPAAQSEEVTAAHRQQRQELRNKNGRNPVSQLDGQQTARQDVEQLRGSERENSSSGDGTDSSIVGKNGGRDKAAFTEEQKRNLLIAAVCVLVLALLIGLLRLWRLLSTKWIEKMIRRKQYRKAVLRINRSIYGILCKKRRLLRRNLTDRRYGELLRSTFPDISYEEWERYMLIVKQVSFSREAVGEEEAGFCYQIFRRVYRNR